MTKQELLDKRMNLVGQADEILAKAKEEKRYDLSTEENTKWEAIHADIDKLTEFVAKMDKQDALAEPNGRRSEPSLTVKPETRARTVGRATAQDHDLAVRGWLLAGKQDPDKGPSDAHREAAARCGINLSAGAITLRMGPPLRSLNPADVEAWEKRAAMGVASGQIGLYTSPDSPMGALERALLAFGGMRQVSTVYRTESGSDFPLPTSDDTSNKGARIAENTQISEVDVTFGQLVLNAYKYSSKLVLVATELLQDSAVDVPGLIGKNLGERLGRIQNDEFTVGTGSSMPLGVVAAATSSSITTAAAATVTYDNIIDLIHKVDPAYRDNSKFMFHDGGLKILKKIKVLQYSGDTSGVPLWQPSLTVGQPDMIHGYPYVINQSVVTPGAGTKSFVFGDFSKYIIRDVREIRLIRMDERYADYDQVGFTAFMRSDGDLLDAGTHPVYYMTQGS